MPTTAPPPGDVLARCRDSGFTPGARDVDWLLQWWADARRGEQGREATKLVVQALSRGEGGVARRLHQGFASDDGEGRALRLRALVRLAGRGAWHELPALLNEALADPDPRVAREAVRAVGKLPGEEGSRFEAALLRIVEHGALPERRAAVEALGRVGGPAAQAGLVARDDDDDDLTRRLAEAQTLLSRRFDRERPSSLRLDAPLPAAVPVWLRCRRGAATVVQQQAIAALSLAPDQLRREPEAISLLWSRSLGELYAVRTFTELALGFTLPRGDSLVSRVVEGLGQPALVAALQAWTDGRPRFALRLTTGGRRRAVLWEVARRLAERSSPLLNDTREVSWTIEVDEPRSRLWCLPRGADPRFTHRLADLPAASHPTFAALLAWLGRPREGELVWDPFCGSGSELVEAARLQPGLHLWGTDLDGTALAAARTNLDAARPNVASLTLQAADALSVHDTPTRGPVSLVITNPPMGHRVTLDEQGVHALLPGLVTHVAPMLAPGGRIVWLTPIPEQTAAAARRAGLHAQSHEPLDMGGLTVTPQVLRKPDDRPRTRR